MYWPARRAIMSVSPPGEYGTITVTGLVGQSMARAASHGCERSRGTRPGGACRSQSTNVPRGIRRYASGRGRSAGSLAMFRAISTPPPQSRLTEGSYPVRRPAPASRSPYGKRRKLIGIPVRQSSDGRSSDSCAHREINRHCQRFSLKTQRCSSKTQRWRLKTPRIGLCSSISTAR
jgi:hypothetical protein